MDDDAAVMDALRAVDAAIAGLSAEACRPEVDAALADLCRARHLLMDALERLAE